MRGLRLRSERTPRRALCRPSRLRRGDVAGVEEAPDALAQMPGAPARAGCSRPPHRGQELPAHYQGRQWATVQVGGGRAITVSEVANELACDWHTVNDAVTTTARPARRRHPGTAQQHHRYRPRLHSFVRPGLSQPHRLRHHSRRRREPPDHRHPPERQRRRRGRLAQKTAQGVEKTRACFGALDTRRPPTRPCTR